MQRENRDAISQAESIASYYSTIRHAAPLQSSHGDFIGDANWPSGE